MTLLHALILGVVEGLTEFLPVSSTGHLILAAQALRLEQTEFLKSFEIAIQSGAILAVVVLYGRTLLLDRRVLLRVLAAFVPTAVLGFLLHDIVKRVLLESVPTVLWALFLGGIALIVFDLFHKENDAAISEVQEIGYGQAVAIGLCQVLAMIPGVSRAAATIVGGQLMGLKRKTIVDFSFLLAIPTMAAATGLDLIKSADAFTQSDMAALAVGFAASFVTAYLAVRWFLQFITRHSFVGFGVYRIIIALIGMLFLL